MGAPLQQFMVTALAGVALLVVVYNARSPSYLVRAFVTQWLVQLTLWGIWTTFVYPHYMSPLRRLPQPKGSHWLLGQGRKLMSESPAAPLREWSVRPPLPWGVVLTCCSGSRPWSTTA